nr:immunoglobulin light chain junction region [Macaca mulatta]MOX07791.1 immunoglobulin light chain junction region [Macaca mulatta]MOX07816.1 immunoglobulin light chain junction region [Macaca mulatta]MOX09635.1 immunoglobulin light chain junction region [Macaca mulatta]MOX10601.1 immunoglobulin light chain junction region [Macaca mulatta]
CQQGKGDPPTF